MITHVFFKPCDELLGDNRIVPWVEYLMYYAGAELKAKACWVPNRQQWAIYHPGCQQPCFYTHTEFKELFILAGKDESNLLDSIIEPCGYNESDEISPIMEQLRVILSHLGVRWYDVSEKIGHMTFERTKFDDVSVVYFYNSEWEFASSYGYPDKLECWCERWDPDPRPMTVGEIIHKYITSTHEEIIHEHITSTLERS